MVSIKAMTAEETDGFNRFITEVLKFEMLELDVERDLVRRMVEHGDMKAREKIANSHIRLVVSMARKLLGYGFPLSELVSAGNVGLTTALNKMAVTESNRFATYAIWWIRACMFDHILANSGPVRLPTGPKYKTAFFQSGRIESANPGLDASALHAKLAKKFGLTEAELRDMRNVLATAQSLDTPMQADDSESMTLGDILPDQSPSAEELLCERDEMDRGINKLKAILSSMNEREIAIFSGRRLKEDPDTLEKLAGVFSVSKERVRQIEVKVYDKVRKAMLADA